VGCVIGQKKSKSEDVEDSSGRLLTDLQEYGQSSAYMLSSWVADYT